MDIIIEFDDIHDKKYVNDKYKNIFTIILFIVSNIVCISVIIYGFDYAILNLICNKNNIFGIIYVLFSIIPFSLLNIFFVVIKKLTKIYGNTIEYYYDMSIFTSFGNLLIIAFYGFHKTYIICPQENMTPIIGFIIGFFMLMLNSIVFMLLVKIIKNIL